MITGSSLSSSTVSALFNLNSLYQKFNTTATSLATGVTTRSPSSLITSTRLQSALAILSGESYVVQQTTNVAATADASLGEVSTLLVEAEGIAVQLSGGGLSRAEVDALQLQLDSIAQSVSTLGSTTTFAGHELFTGNISLNAAGLSVALPSLSDLNLANLDAGDPAASQTTIHAAMETVTTAQGELGAFQKTTLDTYQNVLNNSIIELTMASSFITDTNYAFAIASLTQSQILSQASVLLLNVAGKSSAGVYSLLG